MKQLRLHPRNRAEFNSLEQYREIGCYTAQYEATTFTSGKDTSMARLLVLYKTPKNPEAFDKHYQAVHIPLAKKIPGLQRYDISTGTVGTPAGASDVYLVAALDFESTSTIKLGLASPEGQAAAGDLANFADGGVELLIFETEVV